MAKSNSERIAAMERQLGIPTPGERRHPNAHGCGVTIVQPNVLRTLF